MFSPLSTLGRRAPGHRLARDEQGFGNTRLTTSMSWSTATTVRDFRVPTPNEVEQVGRRLGVDGGKGLVEEDHGRILQQQASEKGPLHLAARQRPDGRRSNREANGRQRFLDAGLVTPPDPAEDSRAGPEAHGDEIVDRERKCPSISAAWGS